MDQVAAQQTTAHSHRPTQDDAAEAIELWMGHLRAAADAKAKAEQVWSEAILAAYGDIELAATLKNDTARKAYADSKTVELFRRAHHAEAAAKAAGAMVELLIKRESKS